MFAVIDEDFSIMNRKIWFIVFQPALLCVMLGLCSSVNLYYFFYKELLDVAGI